jgi:hypothetical protein
VTDVKMVGLRGYTPDEEKVQEVHSTFLQHIITLFRSLKISSDTISPYSCYCFVTLLPIHAFGRAVLSHHEFLIENLLFNLKMLLILRFQKIRFSVLLLDIEGRHKLNSSAGHNCQCLLFFVLKPEFLGRFSAPKNVAKFLDQFCKIHDVLKFGSRMTYRYRHPTLIWKRT